MAKEEKQPGKKIAFFVDNVKYETDLETMNGSQLKSLITGFDPTYQLFEESPGEEPDILITDDITVSLSKDKGPKRFYSVPPATFGL